MAPPTTRLAPGPVQALLYARQRELLREVGREVGAEVIFLKAAWADAALFGGRGVRTGSDLDVLVPPARFEAYALALEARGFKRYEPPTHRATVSFGSKEWTYSHPGAWMPVDLHRELAEPPWFELDVASLLSRAVDWPAGAETIRSLGAEDQVLYAAAHYANHLYEIDGRHAGDIERLLQTRSVDWALIHREAERGGMRLALDLMAERLRARGVDAPASPWASRADVRLRRRLMNHWVEVGAEFRRRRPTGRRSSVLVERPVLSDRWTVLPRWAARYAALRVLDRVLR